MDTFCINLLPELIGEYEQPKELNVEIVLNGKKGNPSKKKKAKESDSDSDSEEDLYGPPTSP